MIFPNDNFVLESNFHEFFINLSIKLFFIIVLDHMM